MDLTTGKFIESRLVREFLEKNPQFKKVTWDGNRVTVFFQENSEDGWKVRELPYDSKIGRLVSALEEDLRWLKIKTEEEKDRGEQTARAIKRFLDTHPRFGRVHWDGQWVRVYFRENPKSFVISGQVSVYSDMIEELEDELRSLGGR
jgi:hypothetical protein